MIKLILDNTIRWDTMMFHRIFGWNGKNLLDKSMLFITHTGDGYYYGLVILIALVVNLQVGLTMLLAGAVAFALELPLYKVMKNAIKRSRPFEQIRGIRFLIQPPDKFSFPSGHTAAAFLMATILSSMIMIPLLTCGLFIWAVMVGISRIYLGVHYPTDVIMGMVLGIACALIGLGVV